MYKVGDKIKIKNRLGIMTCEVIEEVPIGRIIVNNSYFDVIKGLRIEFYKDNWFSIYDSLDETKWNVIYFFHNDLYEDVCGYKCKIIKLKRKHTI